MPNLYIIAGPNGAGKTTASFTMLPEILNCREFVNADEVDSWLVFDNTYTPTELIAEQSAGEITIMNKKTFNAMQQWIKKKTKNS